jgi:hypothetical protein
VSFLYYVEVDTIEDNISEHYCSVVSSVSALRWTTAKVTLLELTGGQ